MDSATTSTANGKSLETSGTAKIFFVICSAILLVAATLSVAFTDREVVTDEVGLFNPIYTYLHTGTMTYPVHGHMYYMVVHPPTHYFVVALLMRCGLSLFHAAGAVVLLLFAILAVLLFLSRISMAMKFGFLAGAYLAVFCWVELYTVRPDFPLALAWMCGLVALEAGRLADWDWRYLLAGSALLGYSSILHYIGYPAVAGAGVYMIWAWCVLPRAMALRRCLVLLLGASAFWVPYLILSVIPDWQAIQGLVRDLQGTWGPLDGLRVHREIYAQWRAAIPENYANNPFLTTLLSPLWISGVPAVFFGVPVLLLFRSTRGLALACLPHLLFLVFGVKRKQINSPAYFAPELIIYLAAMFGVALTILGKAAKAVRVPPAVGLGLGVAVLTAGAVHYTPFDSRKLVGDLDELELTRAASQLILGRDAFVAGGNVPWYTGGAKDYFWIIPILNWKASIQSINREALFSQFDALAVEPFMSYNTANQQRETLTSSYVEGVLQLRGFYFADRRAKSTSELSLMYLSAAPPAKLTGVAVAKRAVYEFQEDPAGDYVFFSAVCPIGDLRNDGRFDYYSTYYLPLKTNADPESRSDCGEATPVIRNILIPNSDFEKEVRPRAGRCWVRTMVHGKLSQLDRRALLADLKAHDRPIRFYRSPLFAATARGKVGAHNTKRIEGALDMNMLRSSQPGWSIQKQAGGVQLASAQVNGAGNAAAQVSVPAGIRQGYLYVRAKVLRGAIDVGVVDSKTKDYLAEQVWDSRDGFTELYLPIYDLNRVGRFIVSNAAEHGGASKVLIEDLALVTRNDGMPPAWDTGAAYPPRPLCSIPPIASADPSSSPGSPLR
ncbi:MAG TPA: hypothetical protein VEU96_28650 [Bryobacteraceae bacterium]|nr:hypothetical protein [Bryobacteraceae bacterium]